MPKYKIEAKTDSHDHFIARFECSQEDVLKEFQSAFRNSDCNGDWIAFVGLRED